MMYMHLYDKFAYTHRSSQMKSNECEDLITFENSANSIKISQALDLAEEGLRQ